MIQFVELVSMDCRKKKETRKTKRMTAVDDEDDDGDIGNDVLTLYQVHLAPFSSQQAAELKICFAPTCGAINKVLVFFTSTLFKLSCQVVYLNKHCVSCKCLHTLAKRLAPY